MRVKIIMIIRLSVWQYKEEQTTPVLGANTYLNLDSTGKTLNVIIATRNDTTEKIILNGKEIKDSLSDDSVSIADGRSDYDSNSAPSMIENGIRRQVEWILDLGCSTTRPNRDWFSTYKEINDGSVLMGNNTACKTVGIGTKKIKLYDEILKTLAEVRHIPDLKKNLILWVPQTPTIISSQQKVEY